MKLRSFHNPNLSLPVARRRVGEELHCLLCDYLDLATSHGKSLSWGHSYPSDGAYRTALYRLRRSGLVAHFDARHKPVIRLTAKAYETLPEIFRPDRAWKQKWNGIWYILVYDVPEEYSAYRQTLRTFLKRMRMGCFQKSVWVSAKDVRPTYDDLVKGAGIRDYAILFEARTVLGQRTEEVVLQAWDMDALRERQKWYCDVYADNLERIQSGTLSSARLERLAREESSAYITVMQDDPLLPGRLLPRDYLGREVYRVHQRLKKSVVKALK